MTRLREEVDLIDLRAAIGEVTDPLVDVARRMGANEAMVGHLLGRRVQYCYAKDGTRRAVTRRSCKYETAMRLVDALNLDPVDVGL